MSNYRRLISYIYAYEGGVKGKNIGFAKLEVRNDQCKLSVNVKKVYVGSNNMGVYLLSGKKELFLGNIFIRNGAGEFRAIVQSSNVENTGTTIDECYGLTVHEVGNAWQAYTTIWEDAVARAAEIDLADVTSEKQMEKNMNRENIREIANATPSREMSAVAEIEREIEQEVEQNTGEAAILGQQKQPVSETAKTEEVGLTSAETKAEEAGLVPEAAKTEEAGLASEAAKTEEAGLAPEEAGREMSGQEQPVLWKQEEKQDLEPACEAASENTIVLEGIESIPYGCEPLQDPAFMTDHSLAGQTEENPVSEAVIEEVSGDDGAEANSEKNSRQADNRMTADNSARTTGSGSQQPAFANGFLNRLANLAAERYRYRPIMEEMNRVGSGSKGELAEEKPVTGENGKKNSEQTKESRSPALAMAMETSQELQPQITSQQQPSIPIGDPNDLMQLELEEKEESSHEQLWENLKKIHTKMPAFDYEHGCEILTIKPQDIGLLPRETWIYGNNSFLLHGYYNYRYLILVKLFNPEGKPRYLLGIPGHYYSNEKYMASMFGFPNFVLAKQQPAEDGRFGFWYTDIHLGD